MPSTRLHLLVTALAAVAAPALAAPRVATDIAPIHSVAAAVMAGVGAPDLIVPPGASPHGYALRPSEAEALNAADLVVWVGPSLTPWLAGPIDALAGDAARLTLEDAPGMRLLAIREGGPFEADNHDHDHDEAAGHDAHDDPAAHEHASDEVHAEETAGEHDHADAHDHAEEHAAETPDQHGHAETQDADADPHLWLDPQNAAIAAMAVADALSRLDPANAAAYVQNAAAFAADMDALSTELSGQLAPLRGRPYFVFHDAYRYFEDRFGVPAAGSIALSDAEAPRAPRVAEIRQRFTQEQVDCVFAEPQFEPKLIATLIEGTPTRTGTLDPLGADLEPGAGLYSALLRGLAEDLAACLDPQS